MEEWVCLVHEFVCAWTRILHMCMQSSSLEMKKKRVQEQEKKKKKERDFYTNWAGDVCGTKRVMIRLFHYEQCNFRLQKVFFLLFSFSFLPTGNTRVFSSNKPEGLKCLKKKKVHTCSTHVPQSKQALQIQQNETVLWILAAIWNVA